MWLNPNLIDKWRLVLALRTYYGVCVVCSAKETFDSNLRGMWAWKPPGGGVAIVLVAAAKLMLYDALASDGKSDVFEAKEAGDIALAMRHEHTFTGYEGSAVHVLEQTPVAQVAVGSSNVRRDPITTVFD